MCTRFYSTACVHTASLPCQLYFIMFSKIEIALAVVKSLTLTQNINISLMDTAGIARYNTYSVTDVLNVCTEIITYMDT